MIERRIFKPEEKMKIVMEGLSVTIEITELCCKYSIATSRFYDWKDKLVKNSADIFDDRERKNTSDQRVIVELREEIRRLKDVVAEITFENLEIKKNWETLEIEGKDMRPVFFDIHRTVMKAGERAEYSISHILKTLRISRSWYYSQMDFSPLLDKRFNPFVVRDEEEWMVVSFKKKPNDIIQGDRIHTDR